MGSSTHFTAATMYFVSAATRFLGEEDGTTAVEYAVMLALIIAVCIGTVTTLATSTAKSFDTSAEAIAGAFGN